MSTEWHIYIHDYYYEPRSITVEVGDVVTWVNKDKDPHIVLGDWGGTYGWLQPGASVSMTILEDEAGKTLRYEDQENSSMYGKIVVSGG